MAHFQRKKLIFFFWLPIQATLVEVLIKIYENQIIVDILDVRFWGAARAAQLLKFREGGSVVLTGGRCDFADTSKLLLVGNL